MESPPLHPDAFVHVRIIIGMILGLSVSRLVTGLTRFVQHPRGGQIYAVHIGWVLYILLAIVHFWWFEFGLSAIPQWTFQIYLFVIFYAILFAVVSSILFPDQIAEYDGFEDYFQSRRKWFYGFLILILAADMVDTAIKGQTTSACWALEYPIRQAIFATCAAIAIVTESKRYQLWFVSLAFLYQITWIVRFFDTLS